MTDQPPDVPPQRSGAENPATTPMPPATGTPVAAPAPAKTRWWHETTSTRGGRWAIGVAAAALVCLMLIGIGVAGIVVLRTHDRFSLMGQRQGGYSRGQDNSRGSGGYQPLRPGTPGMRGGGLGGLKGAAALHGNVTATINGSVQVLAFQRGQVTAVSAASITIKSTDGFVGTYRRTAATTSMRSVPVNGAQAFVLARASDKVAITIMSGPAGEGVGPTS